MKKVLVLVALFIFLKPVFPVLEYFVNYDYIAKNLCVNKAKPMLHCNGKCHLMKQLAKEAEQEKPIQNNKKTLGNDFEVMFFQEVTLFELPLHFQIYKERIADKYSNRYHYLNGCTVFHPPTLV